MGFAIIIVISYHLFFKATCNIPIIKGLISFGWIGVEIFMFVSGWGLYNSLKKNNNTYAFYKKRFIRIFPTYIIINIIFALIEKISIKDFLLRTTTLGYWVGSSYFDWYIPCILLFYLLSPLFFRWLRLNKYTFIIICIVIPFILAEILVSVYGVNDWNLLLFSLTRLPIFCLGFIIAQDDIKISKSLYHSMPIVTGILLVIVCLALRNENITLQTMRILAFVMTIPLCLTIILFLNVVNSNLLKLFFFRCGLISLELYLIHEHTFKNANMTFDFWNVTFMLIFIYTLARLLNAFTSFIISLPPPLKNYKLLLIESLQEDFRTQQFETITLHS